MERAVIAVLSDSEIGHRTDVETVPGPECTGRLTLPQLAGVAAAAVRRKEGIFPTVLAL